MTLKMSRQVDVKALVSHVVRGDGVNKCRICMGDTSEGQVHLNDTVIMEGDKAVTLSELLEVVTGIQVLIDGDLPAGVCTECCMCAISAAEFKSTCLQSWKKWDTILQLIHNLPAQYTQSDKSIFAIIDNKQMFLINEVKEINLQSAAQYLTQNVLKQTATAKEHVTCNCPNCGKKFRHPSKLFHHLKGSTDLQRACQICGKVMSREDLVTHLRKAHNKKPYDCKKCPALLLTYDSYKQHIRKAHSRGTCTCVECGQAFQSRNAFNAHTAVHRHKKCPNCDKIFRNQTCYIYHVKRCSEKGKRKFKNEGSYEVKHSNSSVGGGFTDMKCLQSNINTSEIKSRGSYVVKNCEVRVGRGFTTECICDYCDKSFARKKYLAAHIQIVHMKNTHRPCIYCGKLLASAHMTEHVKKHEIDYTFKCEHCGITLKTKLGYIQHLRLHTGERPYLCRICGETFSASSRRSEHMRRIHKTRDTDMKHTCKYCPAKFRLPYRLKKHIQVSHSSENTEALIVFECKECHEKFGSSRGLLHHSRKHQNIDFPHKKPEKSIMFKVCSEPSFKSAKK